MLELDEISVVHNLGEANQSTALSDVTLTIPENQFVTVVGSNGAGKSSLVKVIAGSVQPATGTVKIHGTDVTSQPDYRRAGMVAHVFDNPENGTISELSIEENMALAIRRGGHRGLRRAVTSARRATMREALSTLGLGLENRLADRAGLLSAGQRQSLTMVMATLSQPTVLLLDEHVAALDPRTQSRVLDLTQAIASRLECSTLMVTHNMKHALEIGDRMLILADGRILGDYTSDQKASISAEALSQNIETLSATETASQRQSSQEDSREPTPAEQRNTPMRTR
ncbi:ABC transporter ATP-binding protein [Nocardia asiatica]|uniref:ABC transporter ATP-binding protein n=1 Tax=Nocardia asiatica TaxID=209252 RepID=UPI000A07B3AE|nr:ATP-binding cassette domain-containing protein [Nocardia asiatica]